MDKFIQHIPKMCIILVVNTSTIARNIMECSTKTKVLRVLNLIVILSLCLWIKYKNDKAKDMIRWNTKIIDSIGLVSLTQSQNSDVLIDIIKELNEQEMKMAFDGGNFTSLDIAESEDTQPMPEIPEVLPRGSDEPVQQKTFATYEVNENGIEEVPASFNQVIEDLQRIDMSIRAFASNNLFQRQSLELIYQKISSGRKELDELNEEDVYYIIEEDRYNDNFVKEVTSEEVDNFEWLFVVSNGVEDNG